MLLLMRTFLLTNVDVVFPKLYKADTHRTRFGNAARFFYLSKANKSVYNRKLYSIGKVDETSS